MQFAQSNSAQDYYTVLKAKVNLLFNSKVELGKAGSNIFVQRCQWDTADSQSTFQGMGRSLVQTLFPDEVLLRSNYRGGSSKIVKNAAKRPSLDSGIMKAIKGE